MRASAERDWQTRTTPEPWTEGARREVPRARRSRPPRPGPSRGSRPGRHARAAGTRAGDLARGLTGSLAAGLVVLALGLIGTQIWSDAHGKFGPGAGVVIGHVVVACVALFLQFVADRRRDPVGGLCATGTFVAVLGALTYWWWF